MYEHLPTFTGFDVKLNPNNHTRLKYDPELNGDMSVGLPKKRASPSKRVGQHFFGSPFLLVRFLLAKQKKMNEDADERK
jgi:hypothetical protein